MFLSLFWLCDCTGLACLFILELEGCQERSRLPWQLCAFSVPVSQSRPSSETGERGQALAWLSEEKELLGRSVLPHWVIPRTHSFSNLAQEGPAMCPGCASGTSCVWLLRGPGGWVSSPVGCRWKVELWGSPWQPFCSPGGSEGGRGRFVSLGEMLAPDELPGAGPEPSVPCVPPWQVHHILQEMVIGGMVLETNMNEIVAQVEAQGKLEKAEGGLSAAPSRAVSAVKNINLPEIPRNINIGDINIKVPNLSQFM
uniref:Adaptor related protein complex 3 subunit sigma 2 n=1 Tax=Junco hyemalis TaxID=40217 RepID=A0A8C5JLJ3_JUNHY